MTQRLIDARIDAFLGIDFNVFNLLLEARLKRRGVPTAHYVSPSVYAWRRGRTRRIARSADVLLTLFPFEPAYYANSAIRAVFVGHPMADEIEPLEDAGALEARRQRAAIRLDRPTEATLIALLPGSRRSELKQLLTLFLDAAVALRRQRPDVEFLLPVRVPSSSTSSSARSTLTPDYRSPCSAAPDARRSAPAMRRW